VALLALAAASSTAFGADGTTAAQQSSGRAAIAYYGGEIARFQKQTWHWQRVMGVPLTPRNVRTLAGLTPAAAQLTAEGWRHRSAKAYEAAQHPPHLRQFLCIHRFEGSWTDTGEPYYGGLQMDRRFQQSYGGWLYRTKGTADHWSPIEQIWTAERALKSRGFWPWPNTARYCGLL
jgi:hypothetical protein